ncbi:MAG: SH3 domain-containing protein [Chloroflexi bacterium]|nr:SH3 domain-containing protein [Chloroflexota bacterium]
MKRRGIFRTAAIIGAVILALVAIQLGAVQRASAQTWPTGTIATGALNVRSGPGTAYNVVTSLYRGTQLSLIARNADASWLKVIVPGGVQGWASSGFIATGYPIFSLPVESVAPSGPTATVATGALNVRSGPGNAYSVVTSLYRGTAMALLARIFDNSWVKVQLSNGTVGWVSTGFITASVSISSLPVDSSYPQPTYPQYPSYPSYPTYPSYPSYPTYPTYRTHVVQTGENLFRIALHYNVPLYTLAAINGIYDVSRIYAGQVLLIP